MNKIVKAMGLIVLAAMVVATTMSCDGFFAAAFSVSGKVVNVQADSTQVAFWKGEGTTTLEGANITLTNKDPASDKDYAGTVGSDGTYSIAGVGPGKYTLSGTRPGWSFVDREVDITGYASVLPDVLAYVTPTDLQQILVMVEWQNTAMDVDAYMTRDSDGDTTYDGMIIAGFDRLNATDPHMPGAGGSFYSTAEGTYGYYFTDPTGNVELQRDIIEVNQSSAQDKLLPRVETIIVKANSTIEETLRYYIRLYRPDGDASSNTLTGYPGASAEATVFVMQGITNKGTYKIAVNSHEYILGILQMKWNNSTSLWNIASYSSPGFDSDDWEDLGGVRSVSGGPVVVESIR